MVSNLNYYNLGPDNFGVAERLSYLVNATPCPFARDSRIWCAPEWKPLLTLEVNLSTVATHFNQFLDLHQTQGIDIFAVEVAPTFLDFPKRAHLANSDLLGTIYALWTSTWSYHFGVSLPTRYSLGSVSV